ncbi:hypothetical protein OVY01_17495 [Robbsia sp. Bb-Pol-6]|uniref:Aminoacyl-transfer RNA synthetases class-II family profile domain-containing protein n=1 Tax=Robbsia betulipollinis TaxID=2981849 RepID=A0ABT3ZRQ8_9BURK|nr:hypothetical protein [Robbsia betulipollinis]MCY0388967.1 hypothetical protein [Robbsia betulipollinis]
MIIEKQWHQVKNVLQEVLDNAFSIDKNATTEFDSLLSIDEIDALGYARNFPHLTCVMCSIEDGELLNFSKGKSRLDHDFKKLDVGMALLPATCYKVYLGLMNSSIEAPYIESCIARCFRHEDKALDNYRAFNFTMKEYVYLGEGESAQAHLDRGYERISALLDQLGITVSCELANDPFFDTSSSVARLSTLTPTKREIVFQGHAVSSLNYHRNYFGEKFNITHGSGFIHTSCVAFGLERWIAMFEEHFGDAAKTLAALATIH